MKDKNAKTQSCVLPSQITSKKEITILKPQVPVMCYHLQVITC